MSEVRLALVIGKASSDDIPEVVDIVRIQPLSCTLFLMETQPFENLKLIQNGASNKLFPATQVFTSDEIRTLLSKISSTEDNH